MAEQSPVKLKTFRVVCEARATIRETWEVEAESYEQARAIMEGDTDPPGKQWPCEPDEVLGDEEDRTVKEIVEVR